MIKYITILFLSFILVGCEQSAKTIYQKNSNGVVLIVNKITETTGGIGTGFILADNQIITNNHVIAGGGEITVFSKNSQREYKAKVVYADHVSDIAVIRLIDWETFKEKENPVNLVLSKRTDIQKGEKIFLIGHPSGLLWTMSAGIISNTDIKKNKNPGYLNQLDAKLYKGNSGGPVFDTDGEVICVNESMLVIEGGSYGFCVPNSLVEKVLYDFNTIKEVRWRILNVSIGLTTDGSYVIIKEIEQFGAAAKAGLLPGDKILQIYTPNSVVEKNRYLTDPDELIVEMTKLKNDQTTISLLIEREGKQKIVEVKTNYKLSKEYPQEERK